MANWTVVRTPKAPRNKAGDIQYEEGPNPRIELPNLVLYVDYVDLDDRARVFTPEGRSTKSVGVYSDSLALILNFIAKECARFNALDADRIAGFQSEIEGADFPADGSLALPVLPDTSKQQALVSAETIYKQKFFAAAAQKSFADLSVVDPTLADAKAAVDAAQAAIADAQAQPIGP